MKKISVLLSVFIILGLMLGTFQSFADEATEITAEDLEVSDPQTLPGNFFYGFKNAWRNVRLFFTTDPVKKVELRLRYTNELMVETQKLLELGKEELVQKTMERYEAHMEKIQEKAEALKEKMQEDLRVGKFLDKLTDKIIKHQILMDRLGENLEDKPEILEKIKENKERALENFGNVMNKIEEQNQEKIQERIENQIQEIKQEKASELQQKLEQYREKIQERVENIGEEIKIQTQNQNKSGR